jgi:hypothetical protein
MQQPTFIKVGEPFPKLRPWSVWKGVHNGKFYQQGVSACYMELLTGKKEAKGDKVYIVKGLNNVVKSIVLRRIRDGKLRPRALDPRSTLVLVDSIQKDEKLPKLQVNSEWVDPLHPDDDVYVYKGESSPIGGYHHFQYQSDDEDKELDVRVWVNEREPTVDKIETVNKRYWSPELLVSTGRFHLPFDGNIKIAPRSGFQWIAVGEVLPDRKPGEIWSTLDGKVTFELVSETKQSPSEELKYVSSSQVDGGAVIVVVDNHTNVVKEISYPSLDRDRHNEPLYLCKQAIEYTVQVGKPLPPTPAGSLWKSSKGDVWISEGWDRGYTYEMVEFRSPCGKFSWAMFVEEGVVRLSGAFEELEPNGWRTSTPKPIDFTLTCISRIPDQLPPVENEGGVKRKLVPLDREKPLNEAIRESKRLRADEEKRESDVPFLAAAKQSLNALYERLDAGDYEAKVYCDNPKRAISLLVANGRVKEGCLQPAGDSLISLAPVAN